MTDHIPPAAGPATPPRTAPADRNSGTARCFGPDARPADPRHTSDPDFGTQPGVGRRPLFATIFWGVLLLAFAAFMVVWTVLPATPDPTLWLLGGVIAIGLVLVAAGIAAASRRAG
jgi:hypothetical protein